MSVKYAKTLGFLLLTGVAGCAYLAYDHTQKRVARKRVYNLGDDKCYAESTEGQPRSKCGCWECGLSEQS